MAVYKNDSLTEQAIYGSSRLGLINYASQTAYRTLGGKKYELSNHLGNVLAVVSDNIHLDQDSTWTTAINTTDYYPFGLAMDGRTVQDSTYRYGFNGQESDGEVKELANSLNYKYRMYDPRVARFFSVDPVSHRYPYWTPYQFAGNMPVKFLDQEGLQPGERAFRAGLRIANPHAYDLEMKAQANMREQMANVEPMEAVHFTLDGFGLLPVLGETADAINGGLYLYEGNYVDAGLSFSGMVPFAGWGATGAKWARRTLKYSDNAFHSASGLVFKQGSKHGNRLSHVMAHSIDDLSKAKHGVFNVGQDNLVSTLDEAWQMAQKGGDNIAKTVQDNGNVSYVIDMGREVGFEGGKKGSGDALNKINIVVEEGTSDVVTAFPTN